MGLAELTNQDRKELNRQRKARLAKRDGTVRAAPVKPKVDEELDGRDGLLWLKQKQRLLAEQLAAAFWVSDRIRDAGDVALRSCLDDTGGGGSATSRSPSPIVSLTSAKRELLLVRWVVLRGQKDMILVVDGVCGARHTLRYLAGGDKHRARDLEVALKLALDQIAAWLKEPKSGA